MAPCICTFWGIFISKITLENLLAIFMEKVVAPSSLCFHCEFLRLVDEEASLHSGNVSLLYVSACVCVCFSLCVVILTRSTSTEKSPGPVST